MGDRYSRACDQVKESPKGFIKKNYQVLTVMINPIKVEEKILLLLFSLFISISIVVCTTRFINIFLQTFHANFAFVPNTVLHLTPIDCLNNRDCELPHCEKQLHVPDDTDKDT